MIMGRPKKHIAVQSEFGFISEIPEVNDPPPHNPSFETALKKSIEALNSRPIAPIDPKIQQMIKNSVENLNKMQDNEIINEQLAQELQLPQFSISNAAIHGPLTSDKMKPYVGDVSGPFALGGVVPNYVANDNPLSKTCIPPQKLVRNTFGLYTHINYSFNEEGFVNWRAMIPTRYLYVGDNIKENKLRRDLFEKKYGKKPELVDLAVDKIDDKDLLITLAGIRYLAVLRGYESVKFNTLSSSNQDFTVVTCDIDWISNYESAATTQNDRGGWGVIFSGVACASTENTNGVFKTYLPEVSSNRAFCRAVRNFLNIDVVSDEEAFEKKDESKATTNGVTPYGNPHELLKAKLEEKGYTFAKLKDGMITKRKDKEWEKYEAIVDIPNLKVFEVLGILKQKEEKEKNPVPE